jgi:hypothetical protein
MSGEFFCVCYQRLRRGMWVGQNKGTQRPSRKISPASELLKVEAGGENNKEEGS